MQAAPAAPTTGAPLLPPMSQNEELRALLRQHNITPPAERD
jgi:hypothetical protein